LFAGTAVLIVGLLAGTLPSAWACSAGETAAESRCCCPERQAPDGVSIEASCCCVAPDDAQHSAPDPQLERPTRPDLIDDVVTATRAPATGPAPALAPCFLSRTFTQPPTLVALHTSLRC